MEEYGKVSIWIGNFRNKEVLDNYMEEIFDDEGDSISLFMTDFKIEYIDSQFQEIDFNPQNESLLKSLEGVSYLGSYVEQLPEINEFFDSIICLYNFKYNETVKTSKPIKFIGCFNFIED